jgi:hypothetical protein
MRKRLVAIGVGSAILISLFVVAIILLRSVGNVLSELDLVGAKKDWEVQTEKKKILLETRPTKEKAIEILGACADYSRGGTNELVLKQLLEREPLNYTEVRSRAAKWPGVLFTTTANVMTWVFLDESNRVVDVVLSPQ